MKNQEETTDKRVEYRDRSYIEKRRILRQLSLKDGMRLLIEKIINDIENIVKIKEVPFNKEIPLISKNFNDANAIINFQDSFRNYIHTLLVDGYLAFEMIMSEDQILDLSQLDPNELIYDGKNFLKNSGNNFKVKLPEKNIIYLTYSDISGSHASSSHVSYVEELKESYERLKIIEDKVFFHPYSEPNGLELVKHLEWKFSLASRVPDHNNYVLYLNRLAELFNKKMFTKIINCGS